jgi:hypothetical protein
MKETPVSCDIQIHFTPHRPGSSDIYFTFLYQSGNEDPLHVCWDPIENRMRFPAD